MAQRSWFYRNIGFWFVPVPAADLGPEEWAKIRRSSRFGKSHRARRLLVVGWIALLAFYAYLALKIVGGDPLDATSSLLIILTMLLLTWFGFRAARIGLVQPSLEDRAVVDYGAEFDALKEKQRVELFQKQTRDAIRGNVPHDEREADLRRRSEATAYRILRPALAIMVAAGWAVCLFARLFESARETFTRTTIAATFFTAAVFLLPIMVRLWTQPDDPSEPKLVPATHKQA